MKWLKGSGSSSLLHAIKKGSACERAMLAGWVSVCKKKLVIAWGIDLAVVVKRKFRVSGASLACPIHLFTTKCGEWEERPCRGKQQSLSNSSTELSEKGVSTIVYTPTRKLRICTSKASSYIGTTSIVLVQEFVQNACKEMVIDTLCNWTNTLIAENVNDGILNKAKDTTRGASSKDALGANAKAVITNIDWGHWPLWRMKWHSMKKPQIHHKQQLITWRRKPEHYSRLVGSSRWAAGVKQVVVKQSIKHKA